MEIKTQYGEVYQFHDEYGILRETSTEELLRLGAGETLDRRIKHAMKARPDIYKTYEATQDAVLDADPLLKHQYALGR